MANLSNLPSDLKYLLLTAYIQDLRTLHSLTWTNKHFNQIYRCCKSQIDSRIGFLDALRYRKEAIFIALNHHRDRVFCFDAPIARTVTVIKEYSWHNENFSNGGSSPSAYSYINLDSIEKDIIRNHEVVWGLYSRFVKDELGKKDPGDAAGCGRPSEAEEKRIILALYRLWVLFLASSEHKESGSVAQAVIKDLFYGAWGLWDIMHVKIIKDWVWKTVIEHPLAAPANILGMFESRQLNSGDGTHDTMKGMVPLSEQKMNCLLEETIVSRLQGRLGQIAQIQAPRICLPGHGSGADDHESAEALVGELERPGVWLHRLLSRGEMNDGVDLGACIWDDERLRIWKYEYPLVEGPTPG